MLSRVANSVYWMSRYLERADNVARFIDVNTHLILDMGWERKLAQWEPLVMTSGDEEDFKQRYQEPTEKAVIGFLTFDQQNPNSILACIQNARENARTIRELISSEIWEAINGLYHFAQKHSRKRGIDDLQQFFIQVKNTNHLIAGLTENIMSHEEGWHFARLGKMIERAEKTARMLDVKYFLLLPTLDYFDSPYDTVEWGAVLKSVNGFEMYRKKFHSVNYRDVANFLIFDSNFPRAIHHCIATAAQSLNCITATLKVQVPAKIEVAVLNAMLKETSIDTVLNNGLHEFIDLLQFNLNALDRSLYKSFFATERHPKSQLQSQANS